MKTLIQLISAALLISLCACSTSLSSRESKQSASIVDYLYPKATQAPKLEPGMTTLRPPVRVGIAFVPTDPRVRSLPEAEKLKLLERAKASFASHSYIGTIEIIPTQYLQQGGGFANMEQVARTFGVDIMAMLSYDQVQFTDSNSLSLLYWTIIGAYVVNGNQYDVHTMVDVSVFDVASRKLLFRAPGTSQIQGGGNWANFSERARAAQLEGYNKAVEQLIPKLQSELDSFRERVKTAANFKVEAREGYRGGGATSWLDIGLTLVLGLLAMMGLRTKKHTKVTST
jgi:rhombotail lipoprotein